MSNDNLRYLHMREYDGFDILGRGGKTICYKEEDDGTIIYTIAYCSSRDNFCRRIGRAISRGRFQSSLHRCEIPKEFRMEREKYGSMVDVVDVIYSWMEEN